MLDYQAIIKSDTATRLLNVFTFEYKQYQYSFPEWAKNRFDIATIHSYNTVLSFTKEQWLGRIKSCRGVGASLSPEKIQAFENEYKNILAKYDEPLKLLHQIHIEIYFAK